MSQAYIMTQKKDKNIVLLVRRVQVFLSIDLVGIEPNEILINGFVSPDRTPVTSWQK